MKTSPILLVILLAGFARAEPAAPEKPMSERELQLAGQMQVAVLGRPNLEKVEALIKEGIDLNKPIACGTCGVLDAAVQTQNVEMLKLFLAHGAKPKGRELVRIASSDAPHCLEIAKTLIAAGVSPNARDGQNLGALEMAAFNKSTDMMQLLLSQPGIKVDAPNDDGDTALMTAIRYGRPETIDLLLKAGANPRIANKRGETAITLAKQELEKREVLLVKLRAIPPSAVPTSAGLATEKPAR